MAISEGMTQLRPGLWETVNERYPESMIRKTDAVSLARLRVPLRQARLGFVSSSGVQPRGSLPLDVAHPIGDFTFRSVPSDSQARDLEIHQLKYPTAGARRDVNVVFPIERLRELVSDGSIGSLSRSLQSFIGYSMDPARVERELAEAIADAALADAPDVVLLAPA